MTNQAVRRRRRVLAGALAGCLTLVPVLVAAQPSGAASAEPVSTAAAAARAAEEVIVTGQRRIGVLIREGAELTEDFYDRLNVVLDDDDFRIDCHSEFPTGSRISRRVCRARFQERLQERQAASILQSIQPDEEGRLDLVNWTGVVEEIGAELTARTRDFELAMLEAVNTDPELNEQFIRLMALKSAVENYETPREQRRREREARRQAQ